MNKDKRKLSTTTVTTLKDKSGYNRQTFDWRQWEQADIQVPVQEPGHCLSFQLRVVEAWGVAWRVGEGRDQGEQDMVSYYMIQEESSCKFESTQSTESPEVKDKA